LRWNEAAEADGPFKAPAVSHNWSCVETRLAALFGSGNSFVRAVSRISVAVQLVTDKPVLVRRKRRLVLGGHEPHQELLALWGYDPPASFASNGQQHPVVIDSKFSKNGVLVAPLRAGDARLGPCAIPL